MNTPLLIDVAKKLRCFLLICGSGELIDEIDKHKHMTKMLPMIPPNRANWYEAMSVFIYPSISSGFPAFPLEAVTMNVPIAISPISDFYSTFGDSMAFFNPNKGVDAAVEAVEKAKAIDPATTRGIVMDKLSEETMLSGFMSVIDG
jgi:glycosyltransferase involved in cell wall biosynthesis